MGLFDDVIDRVGGAVNNLTKKPAASLTELADPFGIDPVGRPLHQWVASWADPQDGQSFADTVNGAKGKGFDIRDQGMTAQADSQAEADQKNRVRQLSASRTLFTGGAGLADSPKTASATLLGY